MTSCTNCTLHRKIVIENSRQFRFNSKFGFLLFPHKIHTQKKIPPSFRGKSGNFAGNVPSDQFSPDSDSDRIHRSRQRRCETASKVARNCSEVASSSIRKKSLETTTKKFVWRTIFLRISEVVTFTSSFAMELVLSSANGEHDLPFTPHSDRKPEPAPASVAMGAASPSPAPCGAAALDTRSQPQPSALQPDDRGPSAHGKKRFEWMLRRKAPVRNSLKYHQGAARDTF